MMMMMMNSGSELLCLGGLSGYRTSCLQRVKVTLITAGVSTILYSDDVRTEPDVMYSDVLTTSSGAQRIPSVGDEDGVDVVGGPEVHLPPTSGASSGSSVGARAVFLVAISVAVHSKTGIIGPSSGALGRLLVLGNVSRCAYVCQS